jgi:hypothetical protein
MQVTIHPEHHRLADMRCVWQRLIESAVHGDLMLLCEGIPYTDENVEKRIRSHDLDWQGICPYINGLEALATAKLEWATAVRYVTGSGGDPETQMKEAGINGIETIRFVCVFFTHLNYETAKSLLNKEMRRFVQEIARQPRGDGSCISRLEAANVVAQAKGCWPGKKLTFAYLQEILRKCMPHIGLVVNNGSTHEDMMHEMNRIIYIDREADFATNIRRMQEAHPDKPIHVLLGAGHAAGLINDTFLEKLHINIDEFRVHQTTIPAGPRLWDLMDCQAVTHPFQTSLLS